MNNKINVTDPGHGGYDNGAQGNSIIEDEYALELCVKVDYHLKRHQAMTNLMTRTSDIYVGLSDRAAFANHRGAGTFVSIHCNSVDNPSAWGLETYTYGTGSNELKLANCVHGAILADKLYTVNRGVKQANFAVLRETAMPAILVEIGFLSNSHDSALMKKSQNDYAKAIARGILEYHGIAWVNERPYGTRDIYVDNKLVASSNKVNDVLAAVEKGLQTTAEIRIVM